MLRSEEQSLRATWPHWSTSRAAKWSVRSQTARRKSDFLIGPTASRADLRTEHATMIKRHEMADADDARKLVRAHFSLSCLSWPVFQRDTALPSFPPATLSLLCPRALST